MGSEGWPSLSYFNSRPCERSDTAKILELEHIISISIHAPARGATEGAPGDLWHGAISIHAPARGATQIGFSFFPKVRDFNSRPCERGDTRWCKSCTGGTKFQFTPLREGRRTTSWTRFYPALFQFTPLREGRPPPSSLHSASRYFNSRPCERGDAVPRLPDGCGGNFNSRPCERGD